jgi:hypothetical protein
MPQRSLKHSTGLALPLVLMSAFIVLGIILLGLQLSADNVLFVAGVHRRNVAQAAAEGGVYRAIALLENQPNYQGQFQESLGDATIEVRVENQLAGAGFAVIESTGRLGRIQKKIQVKIEPSALSFQTVGAQGKIVGRGPNYANGIRAIKNPLNEAVSMHTNFPNDGAINTTDVGDRLSIRGEASAVGTVGPQVEYITKVENQAPKDLINIDKGELLQGTFQTGSVPSNGSVTGNLRVAGNLEFNSPLFLQADSTLHVQGDVKLHKGVAGAGVLVADGDLYIRGSEGLSTQNEEGLLLYADGNINLVHPTATGSGDEYVAVVDPVGDFFARMPENGAYYISESLPVGAPNGIDFLNWYKDQSSNPSDSFSVWRDGDGSEINPGLPANVREWLDSSVEINTELNDWAQNG